jgi:hypothetical protein
MMGFGSMMGAVLLLTAAILLICTQGFRSRPFYLKRCARRQQSSNSDPAASSNDFNADDGPQQPPQSRKTTRPPQVDDFNFWQELLALATVEDMQNILSNIVQENIECVQYATVAIQQGEEVARKQRRPLVRTNGTDSAVFLAYQKLNLLVRCV